jgi:bacterioferritin
MAVAKSSKKAQKIIETLNAILELELAGVVRYTHYSLMVFGHARIPIVKWMREQAGEGLNHAVQAGEQITSLGGHPSLKIGRLLETQRHDIDQILQEAMEHEQEAVDQYRKLLRLVRDKNVMLEEYARQMIHDEEMHLSEIDKMLRYPGKLERVF